MADAGTANIAEETDALQRYWREIDNDPEVKKRREAIERAEREGKAPDDAVYPSDYLAERGGL